MPTPKVLMIAPGGDIHSLRPLNWLLQDGYRVVFCNGVDPFPDGREGYEFINFPYTRGAGLLRKVLGEHIGILLSLWLSTIRLKRLWRRTRPDLVHVHWINDRAYCCMRADLHPLVLTAWGGDIHGLFLPSTSQAFRHRVGETLANADIILADSADMYGKCAELAGREVPVELITQGVNTDRFHPGFAQEALEWRCRLNISESATVLLSIRGWSPLYRHESILKAFAQALPQLHSEAVLVLKILKRATMDRALYETQMRALARELGLDYAVRWMEAVPLDLLPELYSFADVIINYPSRDAFPVTFLEAAACECPVITCRLPAYAGTFAEDYYHLVSSDDHSELSDAIVAFVNGGRDASRATLHELRREVCRKFDEQIASQQLIDIYQKVASRR